MDIEICQAIKRVQFLLDFDQKMRYRLLNTSSKMTTNRSSEKDYKKKNIKTKLGILVCPLACHQVTKWSDVFLPLYWVENILKKVKKSPLKSIVMAKLSLLN